VAARRAEHRRPRLPLHPRDHHQRDRRGHRGPRPGERHRRGLGAAAPGIGFAFVQVPAGIEGLTIDGRESIPATAATVCGLRYRVVGFAFRLVHPPRITAVTARPGWPRLRAATVTSPQTDGMWNIEGPTSTETARGLADQRNRRG
jgi:hypothetical protein